MGYDIGGAVTITLGIVLLAFGITNVGTPHPVLGRWLIPMIAASVLIAMFVVIEWRSRAPLLPPRLVRRRSLAAANAAALTVLAAPFGVSFLVTLYLQDVLGRSPWQTALTLLPGSTLCVMVARYLAPRLLGRLGLRPVYAGGLVIVAAGDALLLAIDEARATWLVIVAALVSFGVGMGLAYPAAVVAGVADVEAADQGTAAGVTNAALQIGGGIGLAVVAAAVSAGLPAGETIAAVANPLPALRHGALAAALLPLVGAAAAGLVPNRNPERPTEPSHSDHSMASTRPGSCQQPAHRTRASSVPPGVAGPIGCRPGPR
jgi:Na+/melibiose symporter-like transporter